MCYSYPSCWTELSVRRNIEGAAGYSRTFAVNRRTSIEVRHVKGTQVTTFRIVTRAVGKEAKDPGTTPSENCKTELKRARHCLDLSITYWLEESPTERVSRELLPLKIRDNFEEIHNRIRALRGLKPERYFSDTTNLAIESPASMLASTVKKIISYTKKVRYDRTRREEILTFFRAGVLVPEDALFHWFKVVEILRRKPWEVLKKVNKPVSRVDGGFLGGFPQVLRHEKDSKHVKKPMIAKWSAMSYKDHLKPVIEYFIEKY